ncbi:MAG: YraN family protein [Prevotella sp.]|nr:YraN family protein [uncultured Prevotella sp.]MED9898896.1 YraN family protein [Prevotella sp.]HRM56050.1 YraN family protein [Prevotella sp.]
MAEHNDLGKWGEDEAALYYEDKGYEILERDWKVGKRDIDLIALTEDKDTLVFVEVKTRQNNDLQEPEEAVDVKKMRNLAIAANAYVKLHGLDMDVRFDIISVIGKCSCVESIECFEDAFNPLLIL